MTAVLEAPSTVAGAPKVGRPRRPSPQLLVLGTVLLLSLPQLMYPMGWDQATYGYYAQELLRGAAPYRDFWEINGPGNFALYALVSLVLGATPLTVNLLAIAETLLTTALLYRLAHAWLGPRYATVGALIYGVSCNIGFDYWARAEPETAIGLLQVVMLLLLTGSWRATRAGWALQLAAGVAVGLAITVKPTAVLLAPIALAAWWLAAPGANLRSTTRVAAMLGLGAGGALAAAAWLLHSVGALDPLVEQWTRYNGEYARSSFSFGFVVFIRGLQSFLFVGPAPILALVGAAMVARRGFRRSVHAFLVVWVSVAMLAVLAQGFRHDYHYNMVFPAASLLAAHFLLATPWRLLWSQSLFKRLALGVYPIVYLFLVAAGNPVRVAAYGLAPLAAAGVVSPQDYRDAFTWRGHHTASRQALVDYLVCHTERGASVYVVGEPAAYFLAGVQSPIRFYHEVPLRFTSDPDAVLEEYRRQLAAVPPPQFIAIHDSPMEYYVTQRKAIEAMLQPLLSEHYVEAYTADRVRIYRHGQHSTGQSSRCRPAPA